MKKIFQIGFVLALAALLPTGVLFAGDGNGNGTGDGKGNKSKVTVKPIDEAGTSIIVIVNTTDEIDINSLQVISKTPGTSVKEISPVLGGIQVAVELDHASFHANNEDNVGIVIEIVGVDNITGINVTDGENGTPIPASITGIDDEDNSSTDGTSSNNSVSGYHSQPNTQSSNGGGSIGGTLTVTSARKDIAIYPNPIMDHTNVVTVGEILGRFIEIIDLAGHPVMIVNVAEGSRQTTLDLSNLTPGIYVIMYHTQDGQTISKRIQKI